MDAVEFYKAFKRMCDKTDCKDCLLDQKCRPSANVEPEEVVKLVEEWAKEHPIKTRQSEFLKLFPDAEMVNIERTFCVAHFEPTKKCKGVNPSEEQCIACRYRFWNEEVTDNGND